MCYVYKNICSYIYIYIYIYTHTHTHTCTHIHTHIYTLQKILLTKTGCDFWDDFLSCCHARLQLHTCLPELAAHSHGWLARLTPSLPHTHLYTHMHSGTLGIYTLFFYWLTYNVYSLALYYAHHDFYSSCRSLGLALTPRVRFIEREKNKQLHQQTHGNSSVEAVSNKTNKTASVKVPSAGSTDEEESESKDTSLSSNENSHDSDSSGENMERNQESERNGLNFGQDMQDNDDNLFRVKEQSQSLHYSSGDEKDMEIKNVSVR